MTAVELARVESRARVWMANAVCRRERVDPDVFFPLSTRHVDGRYALREVAYAKSICGRCDVTVECAAYAIREHITDGIWGGLTEKERRARPRV